MEFKKYPSIENSYREKQINYWVNNYPELLDEEYIIVEKIHGANFQLLINQDNVRFASRNQMLEEKSSFFEYQNVMSKYNSLINTLKSFAIKKNIELIRVYGELFGSNIQKGVDYGEDKKFKIFDIYIDDELLSQEETISLLKSEGLERYFVPILDIVKGLDNAMDYDSEFNTKLINKEDNISEGVVIKPYSKAYCNQEGSVFYLKKKNEAFIQKQKQSRTKRKEKSSQFIKVQDLFSEYLNENRVQGVFSKYGEIEDEKDIGKYISLVVEDAKEDFFKDNNDEFILLENKEKRAIFSIGGKYIYPILNRYL